MFLFAASWRRRRCCCCRQLRDKVKGIFFVDSNETSLRHCCCCCYWFNHPSTAHYGLVVDSLSRLDRSIVLPVAVQSTSNSMFKRVLISLPLTALSLPAKQSTIQHVLCACGVCGSKERRTRKENGSGSYDRFSRTRIQLAEETSLPPTEKEK